MGNRLEISARTIDRFEIRRVLGEGGQGIVYLAYDPRLKREVAIKTLAAQARSDTQALLQEARTVSALAHPCIVPIFEAAEFCGAAYLVFEYVTGETLDALLKRSGPLPADCALKIAAQVLDGLDYAHRHGVLHRDIKPANIMLDRDGNPRIMDFGAACRHTAGSLVAVPADQSALLGTPAYMAPEYIERGEYGVASELFAAGLVCCEMLTGERMYQGDAGGVPGLLARIVRDPVELPAGHGLDAKIVAWLLKALAKDPAARHASAAAMKEAMPGFAETQTPSAADGRGTVEFLLRRMRLKKEFPAISQAISRVNAIIFSDSGSVAALANAVLKDFALTNKIIKLANSSYYNRSGRGNIGTISGAVYRLGFDTIRNIVLGLLLFDHLKDRGQAKELMAECVQAVLGGAIAMEICIARGYANAEETSVCAMLHNLGRMLSLYYFPDETGEIRKLLALGEASEDQASRKVLGASYTELGQGVARSWGFPLKIIACMDKRPPQNGARAPAGEDETARLIACMAADLSAAALAAEPEERERRAEQALGKYRERLKLDAKAAQGVLHRSLANFREYTVAAAWTLEPGLAKTLGALEQAGRNPEKTAPSAGTTTADLQELDRTLRLEPPPPLPVASPAPADAPVRGKREVLSAGIQDITNAMVEGSNLNDILRIIIETIYRGIGFDHAILAVRDPKRDEMHGRFGLGEDIDALVEGLRFPLEFAPDVFHVALRQNIDIFISDSREARIAPRIPEWYRKRFAAGAFLLLPIIVRDKAFGMIYADAAGANAIGLAADEIKLLRTLRNQAVLAVRQSA